jgi:hypothetical protein
VESSEKMVSLAKMVGKVVYVQSFEANGLIKKVLDAETFLVDFGGEVERISVFDVRSV